MFGIGGTEFLVIAVVGLLLFGPDKLPQFARTLGRFMRDFKRYQAMMEAAIRSEMNAVEGAADPFKKGKEFREQVQAEQAARASEKTGEEPDEQSVEPPGPDEPEAPAVYEDEPILGPRHWAQPPAVAPQVQADATGKEERSDSES